MKTLFSKSVLVAFITLVGASLSGCGGSAASAGSSADDASRQKEIAGTTVELPHPASDMDYDNLFGRIKDTENYDIMTLARMNQNLSTFATLAQMSNLDLKLDYTGPVTLFIPTNKAFNEMPSEQFNALTDPANKAQLARFIQRHILPNEVFSVDLNSSQAIETASEEEITVDTDMNGNIIYVGGAQVVKSDIDAANGVIHIVNSIIEPTRDVFAD